MFYLRQVGLGRIALKVPERAEDFTGGETGDAPVLREDGSDIPKERLAGTIRLTADTLEVAPDRE